MPAGHAYLEDLVAASNFYNLKVNGTTRLLYAGSWRILIVDITTNEKGKVTSYKGTRQKFSKVYFWIKDE